MGHKTKKVKLDNEVESNDVELKEAVDVEDNDDDDYEKKMQFINPIASPMASKKLVKRLFKCIKKASKHKTFIRQGLKEVQKHIRRGEKG
jgi:hypothetical protein